MQNNVSETVRDSFGQTPEESDKSYRNKYSGKLEACRSGGIDGCDNVSACTRTHRRPSVR